MKKYGIIIIADALTGAGKASSVQISIDEALKMKEAGVTIVLGDKKEEILATHKTGKVVVGINQSPGTGAVSYIHTGLRRLTQSFTDINGCIFTSSSAPTNAAMFEKIIAERNNSGKGIITSKESISGMPAYFDLAYFDQIMLLTGKQDLSKVISANKKDVSVVK